MEKPCPLHAEHSVERFDCGVEALNLFLKNHALANEKNGSGRTYVTLHQGQIAGFYAIASGSVIYDDAPGRLKKGLSRNPVPIALLGRFAVDRRFQGKGLGQKLLADALLQVLKVSERIGIRAVVVDAKDESAKQFYIRLGFVPFEETGQPMRLYCLIKDIRKTFAHFSEQPS